MVEHDLDTAPPAPQRVSAPPIDAKTPGMGIEDGDIDAATRVPCHLSVRLRHPSGPVSATVGNLSLGGMYIEASATIPVDTGVEIDLDLPGGTVHLSGRVLWGRTYDEGDAGMGIVFGAVNREQAELIRDVILETTEPCSRPQARSFA